MRICQSPDAFIPGCRAAGSSRVRVRAFRDRPGRRGGARHRCLNRRVYRRAARARRRARACGRCRRGQLAWQLRQDRRVVVHEGVNARYLSRREIPEPIDLITCDASFIGLATVLPAPLSLAGERAGLIALIKPQFEAGPAEVGRGGVVRDTAVHRAVCERVSAWVAAQPDWGVVGIVESPIQGPPAIANSCFTPAARARERCGRVSCRDAGTSPDQHRPVDFCDDAREVACPAAARSWLPRTIRRSVGPETGARKALESLRDRSLKRSRNDVWR